MRVLPRVFVGVVCVFLTAFPAAAQQRGSISGAISDADGLVLPGVTVTVTEQGTGFSRTVITAETGAYTIPNLDPGVYTMTAELPGFAPIRQQNVTLTAGSALTLDVRMQVATVTEDVVVTAEVPLIQMTSNQLGGSLSSREIEEIPSNFRNFTALTQLVPGITPNPAASTFEGGQVVANGTPSQQNVYLIDGMYNNDDRLGGSQGTQVRVVLDNIAEYQVLSNQYSGEFGGGAGAIINMITRGGGNAFSGRAYTYFRDDRFNARGHFLPAGAPKPQERTLQAGFAVGGPIIRNRAHFYFTMEKDHEDLAGQKRFPAAAAPLARDMIGAFTVRATNYFARGDVQFNPSNIVNVRWVLETAPTRGEGFNTNSETIDAQGWESDWDHLVSGSYTTIFSSRASNVMRFGRIGEELGTGAQAFFDDNVKQIGFDGRNPFSIGQRNVHPSYITGKGGEGLNTRIRTYVFDEAFSYFAPRLWGREHNFKTGFGVSFNEMPPRTTFSSGTFQFRTDAPYDPANPATFPFQFNVTVGPPSEWGYEVFSRDRRYYAFLEDKMAVSSNLTLNLGLRYDHQQQTPGSKDDVAPRVGVAWDVTGSGNTVVRGGIGKFYAYPPVVLDLTLQQNAVRTRFPAVAINEAHPLAPVVLRPDVISDSQGNRGVAQLSQAGQAALNQLRDQILGGATFNPNPWVDSADRQLPYTWSWSVGVNHQVLGECGGRGRLSRQHVARPARRRRSQRAGQPRAAGDQHHRPHRPADSGGGARHAVRARAAGADEPALQRRLPVAAGVVAAAHGEPLERPPRLHAAGEPLRRPGQPRRAPRVARHRPARRLRALRLRPPARAGGERHGERVAGAERRGGASAISGAPINETVGSDVNGDLDNNDRPIRGINDLTIPIRSAVDSQGRAVINGLQGPGSFLIDVSFRYQLPLAQGLESLDLFYDIFNILKRENLVAPTGNRASSTFMIPTAAQFPRQMQFGIRVRF